MVPIGRRSAVLGLLGVVGCSRGAAGTSPTSGRLRTGVELWSWFDLPGDDMRARELSGIAWDAKAGVAWAVQDEAAHIVALRPDRTLRSWKLGESIAVDGGPHGARLDLEGIVALPDGFLVCSEVGPRVFEVDRAGRFRRELTLPPRFHDARLNKSVESLTRSPSGRYLFLTSEIALEGDGDESTPRAGTRVRVVRIDLERPEASREHLYITDPSPEDGWDWGVSDLTALDDDELLVLERGWKRGYGNAIRIYRVELDERSMCTEVSPLSGANASLAKWLFVDLGDLRYATRPPVHQPEPSALLDNFEGMGLGPRLADGRRSLLLVSDDNAHRAQIARVVVLAW